VTGTFASPGGHRGVWFGWSEEENFIIVLRIFSPSKGLDQTPLCPPATAPVGFGGRVYVLGCELLGCGVNHMVVWWPV